jgi:hypothetical protein
MSRSATAEAITEPVAPTAEVAAPVKIKPLDPARFMQTVHARNEYSVTLPPGVPFEALDDPMFFRGVAHKIGLGDIIECRSADLTEFGTYVIVACDHNALHVSLRELFRKQVAPADLGKSIGPAYTVSYSGDITRGWQVHRNADGKLMRDGFKRQEDAQHHVTSDLAVRKI